MDQGEYTEIQVTLDNIPEIGDKTGEKFLHNLEDAVKECKSLISEGYRLTDFWTDPDVGVQFILKKKK
ncbi:MAG: hypothetical protein K6T80_02410 [Firmicutes bacterium]|nr:hypothetical protein [Bacillota bacterium]